MITLVYGTQIISRYGHNCMLCSDPSQQCWTFKPPLVYMRAELQHTKLWHTVRLARRQTVRLARRQTATPIPYYLTISCNGTKQYLWYCAPYTDHSAHWQTVTPIHAPPTPATLRVSGHSIFSPYPVIHSATTSGGP